MKNNHRWGIAAAIIAIILASVGTICLYPYLKQRAAAYHYDGQERTENAEGQQEELSDLATQAINYSYVIWHQQRQEEEGRFLTYAQTYLRRADAAEPAPESSGAAAEPAPESSGAAAEPAPESSSAAAESSPESSGAAAEQALESSDTALESDEISSEYSYDELRDIIDEAGSAWERLCQKNSDRFSYAVIGTDGAYGDTNVSDPNTVFSEAVKEGELSFRLHFSESGRLSVEEINGEERAAAAMMRNLNRFSFYDPLETRLSSSYRYSGYLFSGPRNLTIVFRCTYQTADGGGQLTSDQAAAPQVRQTPWWGYQSEGSYRMVMLVMCLFLTVSALVLPCIKGLAMGQGPMCRMSFEPLIFIGGIWLCVAADGKPLVNLIAFSAEGGMGRELVSAGFLPWAASVLTAAANLLCWFVIYGLYYWGITNLRAVGSMGLWRYFKERTWTGRFLRWAKRILWRCLNSLEQIDWDSSSTKLILKAVAVNFVVLMLISCLWFLGIFALIVYSAFLFWFLQRYWKRMEEKYQILLRGINQIAEGNLEVEISEDLGLFNPIKEQLTRIQKGFRKAVEQEVKSERMKSELITNVSHDLKTPLTAIITYVNLLKQESITEEERKAYIQVLDQKSMRLKALIEDLFEVSKASSGSVSLHLEEVDLVSLIRQVYFELSDKVEGCGVEFRLHLPQERVALMLDSQKTCRIFENLLVNVTKYALKGTRAYIQLTREAQSVVVVVRNISANELTMDPEELTERFVRGDEARNTDGSGLGLAIARSFTELQGGTMKLELEDDIFRVTITFPAPGSAG